MKSCFVYTGILSPDQLLLMIQAIERTNFHRVAAENVPGIVSQNTFRGTFWQGEVAGMHTLILTNPVGKYVIAIEGPAGAKGGDILWQTYVKRQVEAALGMLSSQGMRSENHCGGAEPCVRSDALVDYPASSGFF